MKINYIKEIDDSKVYDVAEKTPISLLNKISTKYNNTVFLKEKICSQFFLLNVVVLIIKSLA